MDHTHAHGVEGCPSYATTTPAHCNTGEWVSLLQKKGSGKVPGEHTHRRIGRRDGGEMTSSKHRVKTRTPHTLEGRERKRAAIESRMDKGGSVFVVAF